MSNIFLARLYPLDQRSSGFRISLLYKKELSDRMKKNNPMKKKEIREKVSQNRKGRFSGKNNSFYGKKHTDEIRKKLSLKRKTESKKTTELRLASWKKTRQEFPERWCKKYKLISPKGEEIIVIDGLEKIAKELNLTASVLIVMLREKRTATNGRNKGWFIEKL